MKKNWLKTGAAILFFGCGGVFLFRHYTITREPSIKSVMESSVEFPKQYKKKITENLEFDAAIVIAKNVDTKHLYMAKATEQSINREKWANKLMPQGMKAREEEDTDRQLQSCKEWVYELDDETILRMTSGRVIYMKLPLMGYVFDTFLEGASEIGKYYTQDEDLGFATRMQAEQELKKELQECGTDIDELVLRNCYAMDAKRLEKNDKPTDEEGKLQVDEIKAEWTEEDEGYYYEWTQCFQGLPVYYGAKVSADGLDEADMPLQIYQTKNGMQYVYMEGIFSFEKQKEEQKLASWEKISESLQERFSDLKMESRFVVKRCELYEFPLWVEKQEYQMRPVWICTVEEQFSDIESGSSQGSEEGDVQNIYIPIDAQTGEEMFELEG